MGILSSMYTGITGMAGQGEALAVYGDNIANANTTGFKVSRPEFQDVIAKSLKGVDGGNQIGRGTRLAAVNPIFSQGSITQTENPTDLAITGDGFFVLDGQDGRTYTRNGAFKFNKDGHLVNTDGIQVMGFEADEKGQITSKMGAIGIDRSVIDAHKTNEVKLYMNLDLRSDKMQQFDPERPEQTCQFSTGVNVYDTAGAAHVVSVMFNKTDDQVWTWRAMCKGDEIVGGKPGQLVEQARGTLKFDTDGRLMSQTTDKSDFQFNKGALPDQNVHFDFGKDKQNGGPGTTVTQYGTNSEAYKTIQDGYTAGTLSGLNINDDGILSAIYNNGETINLSQLALAKFEAPEGLFKIGMNRFRESRASGQATVGAPQAGGRGRISAKTIESSTTDIASEFINLMNAQRSFQANSRVINVADEMMGEVLNLKRGG